MNPSDPPTLWKSLCAGNRRALARMLTLAESDPSAYRELADAVAQQTRGALRIGLTGPGGAGKSTIVDALCRVFRRRDQTVGVLATDPSSDRTGGALLGDRVRSSSSEPDAGLFFRSVASRGASGGLSLATHDLLDLLDAFGLQRLLIEAVGAGQSEVGIASVADLTVVVFAPGGGDSVQAMKAGLMEVGDLFVISKADLPGAEEAAKVLESALHLEARERGNPHPALVLTVSALENRGIDGLADAIEQRADSLRESGELNRRRQARVAHRVRGMALHHLEVELDRHLSEYEAHHATTPPSPHRLALQLARDLLAPRDEQ